MTRFATELRLGPLLNLKGNQTTRTGVKGGETDMEEDGETYVAKSIGDISVGLVGRRGFSRLVDLVSRSKPL